MASSANAAAAAAKATRSGKPEGMTALSTLDMFILSPQVRPMPAGGNLKRRRSQMVARVRRIGGESLLKASFKDRS
jgi:hypothetical protein